VNLTIIHVSSTGPKRNELIQSDFNVRSYLLEKAHKAIHKTRKRFHEEGIAYRIEVALGDPAEEIVKLAHQLQVNLIIIGSRGLNRLKEVILGSVSHQVAHEAGCPVMIVK
jgi:nucleotide-binding universal stress UspA family protein